jgi:hypothetical protein
MTSADLDWEVDGVQLFSSDKEVDEFWRLIEPIDANSECISGHAGQSWVGYWWYSIGSFDDVGGTHIVKLEQSFDHPITDGFDSDGDGRPDLYSGSSGLASTEIVVVAP